MKEKAKTMSVGTTEQQGTLQSIAVELLVPNPWNKRRWHGDDHDDLDLCALRDSIESTNGNIQRVVVRPLGDIKLQIICGERRWRAIRMSKSVTAVNCEVRELSDEQACEFCLAENARRKNLGPLEEAETVQAWMGAHPNWTLDEVARHMGISRPTAARRLALGGLAERWKAAVYDQKNWLSGFNAGMLETVAALPAGTQERLYDSVNNIGLYYRDNFNLSILRNQIGALLRKLDAVPWALDEGDMPCIKCVRRSSCQPDLWDGQKIDPDTDEDEDEWGDDGEPKPKEKSVVKGDVCLDGVCFDVKMETYRQAKLTALREKHPSLVLFLDYNEPAPWMGATGKTYDFEKCKKTTLGAIPTISLSNLEGGVQWMTPCGSRGRKAAASAKPVQSKAEGMVQKRANLDRLRWRIALSLILRDLQGMCQQKQLPTKPTNEIIGLAHVGGTNNRHAHDVYGNADFWEKVDSASLNSARSLDELYLAAAEVVVTRLRAIQNFNDHDCQREATGVCDFFDMHLANYWTQAVEAKPEPKSWTKGGSE